MSQRIPTAAELPFASLSQATCSIPFLEAFLGAPVRYRPSGPVSGVVGRAQDPSQQEAKEYARAQGVPYLSVEEGFLRSLSPGSGAFSLSLIADGTGIYHDASAPSDLENLLNSQGWESPDLLASARKAMDSLLAHGLSRYNHYPEARPGMLGSGSKKRILVIDQPAGDPSVTGGMADEQSFRRMLEDAAARQDATVTLAAAPDVPDGSGPGCLDRTAGKLGIRRISPMVQPLSLLKEADEVYCVASHMGFEALMLGKPVHCYGMPFYAGWGLTDDILSCPRRKARRTVLEMFAAAYMLYTRYADPIEGIRCDIHGAITRLALQKEKNEANRGHHACWGYPRWKQPYARAFLQGTESTFTFLSRFAGSKRVAGCAARHGGDVVAWSSKVRDGELPAQCRKAGVELIRMEDGFIRSVGLGSNFQWPYSLVLDRSGIYYDPTGPSDLEHLLNAIPSRTDHDQLCEEAAKLRGFIVSKGITKYNVGKGGISRGKWPSGKRVLLVPGQVEEDASVRSGGGAIQSNLGLLKAVRQANPDGIILFKPHPDVEAKNRKGKIPDDLALTLADEVLRGVRMDAVLPEIDEVHTLTSLTGFEALLRGIRVTAYGGPFYAGWGLTTDMADPSSPFFRRRQARLTLDELVAGTLMLYPSYYDWQTRSFCSAMDVCHRLLQPGAPQRGNRLLRFVVSLRRKLGKLA